MLAGGQLPGREGSRRNIGDGLWGRMSWAIKCVDIGTRRQWSK